MLSVRITETIPAEYYEKQFESVLNEELKNAVKETLEYGKKSVGAKIPVVFGTLLEGLIIRLIPTEGRTVMGSMQYEDKAEKYGFVVERGRRPGKAPGSTNLLPWVGAVMGLSGKAAVRTAFAISQSIKKRGTRATNIWEHTLPSFKIYFSHAVKEALNRTIRKAKNG